MTGQSSPLWKQPLRKSAFFFLFIQLQFRKTTEKANFGGFKVSTETLENAKSFHILIKNGFETHWGDQPDLLKYQKTLELNNKYVFSIKISEMKLDNLYHLENSDYFLHRLYLQRFGRSVVRPSSGISCRNSLADTELRTVLFI